MINNIYKIIDTKTQYQVGKDYQGRKGRNKANNRIDKLNNAHGCYRYIIKTIFNNKYGGKI